MCCFLMQKIVFLRVFSTESVMVVVISSVVCTCANVVYDDAGALSTAKSHVRSLADVRAGK